ncbi:MAG: hypothetical protein JWN62_1602 [Acidimicrobiales bacterium]|nr:hypothetical protein [Acidimicrobiales bacterium]
MTRSLKGDIDRLTARARPKTTATDDEVLAKYDDGVHPDDLRDWLYRQEWRRAHRATLAGMAITVAAAMKHESLDFKPHLLMPEMTALAIASAPLGQEPWADAVRMMEIGSNVPTGPPHMMSKPNMRRFYMHRYFAYCVLRIQLGGTDGIGIRTDIAAGRYTSVGIDYSFFHPSKYQEQDLEFPGPNGESYGDPWPATYRVLPDGSHCARGTGLEITQRFTTAEAERWPG